MGCAIAHECALAHDMGDGAWPMRNRAYPCAIAHGMRNLKRLASCLSVIFILIWVFSDEDAVRGCFDCFVC